LLWSRVGTSRTSGIAVDSGGNVFITPGIDSSPAAYSHLAKYSSSGDLLWERHHTRDSESFIHSPRAAIDTQGRCIIAGVFYRGEIRMEDTLLRTEANYELFIARYGPQGELEWARQTKGLDPMGSGGGRRISRVGNVSLALTAAGDIFISGDIAGSVVFDSHILDGGENPTGEPGNERLFIARLVDTGSVLPVLTLVRDGNQIQLRWSTRLAGAILESTDTLEEPDWRAIAGELEAEGEHYILRTLATAGHRFFRLRQP
jgi:hypothetical protein